MLHKQKAASFKKESLQHAAKPHEIRVERCYIFKRPLIVVVEVWNIGQGEFDVFGWSLFEVSDV